MNFDKEKICQNAFCEEAKFWLNLMYIQKNSKYTKIACMILRACSWNIILTYFLFTAIHIIVKSKQINESQQYFVWKIYETFD